ncbi:DUF1275 family protein [Nonomuraea sp. NPDC049695]|uniref:DUF1275 family protein n=1 Tax=Nonomuraea sp. NPDC049695 TaxID=3154734 RepID=UPI00341D410E
MLSAPPPAGRTGGLVAAFRFIGSAIGWATRIRLALAAELGPLIALAIAWALSGPHLPLIATAALAMGVQSAVTHRLRTFIGSTTFITDALTSSISRLLTPEDGRSHVPELVAVLLALALGAAAATARQPLRDRLPP